MMIYSMMDFQMAFGAMMNTGAMRNVMHTIRNRRKEKRERNQRIIFGC